MAQLLRVNGRRAFFYRLWNVFCELALSSDGIYQMLVI